MDFTTKPEQLALGLYTDTATSNNRGLGGSCAPPPPPRRTVDVWLPEPPLVGTIWFPQWVEPAGANFVIVIDKFFGPKGDEFVTVYFPHNERSSPYTLFSLKQLFTQITSKVRVIS